MPRAGTTLLLLAVVAVSHAPFYVPVIAAFQPNLSGMSSRMNLFATMGGAVFWTSFLMGLARIVGRNRAEVKTLFVTSVLPLLFPGIVTQWAVQYHGRQAWREQKSIWRQLFEIAPGFHDGTTVLFVLPGFVDRFGYQNWRRPPLEAPWEVQSALRVVYDNPTLKGEVIFPDIELISSRGAAAYERQAAARASAASGALVVVGASQRSRWP